MAVAGFSKFRHHINEHRRSPSFNNFIVRSASPTRCSVSFGAKNVDRWPATVRITPYRDKNPTRDAQWGARSSTGTMVKINLGASLRAKSSRRAGQAENSGQRASHTHAEKEVDSWSQELRTEPRSFEYARSSKGPKNETSTHTPHKLFRLSARDSGPSLCPTPACVNSPRLRVYKSKI